MDRKFAGGLPALALIFLAPLASAQSPLRIQVSDAISGAIPKPVTVRVVDAEGEWFGVTDENGVVEFAELYPLETGEPDQYPILMIETSANDYLPVRKEISVGSETWHAQIALVPKRSGYTTPVISAATGGRLRLPNIGVLSVAPGVLGADARLQLTVIPNSAMSPSMVEGQLYYELSCFALDADGFPQPGTLPLNPGGVTLSVTLPKWGDPLEALTSETWSTYSFNEGWQSLATTTVGAVDKGVNVAVSIPLVEGFNLLERDYRTVSTSGGCEWGPWKVHVVLLGTTPIPGGGQGQSVICGKYTENDCIEVGEGEEHSTDWEVGAEVESKTEVKADALLGSVSESVGVKVSGSYGEGQVKSTTTAKKRCKESGQSINGDSSPSPPWSCISGGMEMTKTLSQYAIWLRRTCTHSNGTISSESVSAGVMDLPGPLINVWNVSIDETCEGCDTDPPQELPSPLPK